MDDKDKGMYDKFDIRSVRHEPLLGEYFTLDLFHDPYAVEAAKDYARRNKKGVFELVIDHMHKYIVKRVDRADVVPQDKHWRCMYIVLDISRDYRATEAMKGYAAHCEHEYLLLAKDIRKRISG